MKGAWHRLREWNGSQSDAFEELCCQLAHAEAMPADARFVRNAPPDAGVECYWRISSGEEWGWQAKFPDGGLSDTLLSQVDTSVAAALDKRPRLTRYTICLPFSLPEPKLNKRVSARDRWDRRVAKWEKLAEGKGRHVEFVLWDDHELWLRLSEEKHRGRRMFWFDETIFGAEWFRRHVEGAIEQAGDRYDAALNVKVAENDLFLALARAPLLWKRLHKWAIELREALRKNLRHEDDKSAGTEIKNLRQCLVATIEAINTLAADEVSILDFPEVDKRLSKAADACDALRRKLWEAEAKAVEEFERKHGRHPERYEHNRDGFAWHSLQEIERRVSVTRAFLNTTPAKLVNLPVLLLTGQAGTGKTHALCNAAERLVEAAAPVILLLGEQFDRSEPWSQVLAQLGLSCSRDEFLGALDAAAEAARIRTVIILDALNEGEGIRLWPSYLSSFLTQIRHWPRLSVCFSLRSGYEPAVLPNKFNPSKFIKVEHHGFANIELEAATQFFSYFGITTPSVPVLSPDFANPLFLKLFCRALHNAGLKEVPTGVQGITAVFDFFLGTVNDKLAKPSALDFDPSSQPVQRAVNRLAELMIAVGTPTLPVGQVQTELNSILPSVGYQQSLERHLTLEGIINRQIEYDYRAKTRYEVVRFAYQRFTDHRIVSALLRKTKTTGATQIFHKGSAFWNLIKQAGCYWQTQGLWDALAIQLSESFQIELPDALKRSSNHDDIRDAFLTSVIWRDRAAFGPRSNHWVAHYRKQSPDIYAKVLNAVLTVSPCAGHPFNADYLNDYLSAQKMATRDAQWSIFLFEEYGTGTSVDRLIEWGFSDRAHRSADDETVRLGATALIWFLTTSHRFVRDRATKALVSLLQYRISILRTLLTKFEAVDDPYVAERLVAVAFGCALTTDNVRELGALAQQVYDTIFSSGSPPPHIILRDSAKGVVQAAMSRGMQLNIETSKLIPPYRSAWVGRVPTLDTLEKKIGDWDDTAEQRGARLLVGSVLHDDFGTYELNDVRMWTPRRIGSKRPPSALKTYIAFEESLLPFQRELLRQFEFREHPSAAWFQADRLCIGEKANQDRMAAAQALLDKSLTAEQQKLFRRAIMPLIDGGGRPTSEETFSKAFLQRWIIHRALKLGWKKSRFGAFDNGVSKSGRDAYKPERIGKKYQWIALHEFYARLSDNFEFNAQTYSLSESAKKDGRWTRQFRDIDPSLLIRSTPRAIWEVNHEAWWTPFRYDNWFCKPTKLTWLNNVDDLPDPAALLEVKNPRDATEWYILEGFVKWGRQEAIGSLREKEGETQEIWYAFDSYMVEAGEFKKLWEWASTEIRSDRFMPEAGHRLRVLLWEHYRSPHFSFPLEEEWETEFGYSEKLPARIILTNDQYLCERGTHDCSVDDTIGIDLPARWLVEKMKLSMKGRRGDFCDGDGTIVAFDPSAHEPGPAALLIRKESLLEFLKSAGYRLFWTVRAEKNIYPPGFTSSSDWLGRLTLDGTYTISNNVIGGSLHSAFHAGDLKTDVNLSVQE